MGQAIQGMIENPRWSAYSGTDGNYYVRAEGTAYYNNSPAYTIITFKMLSSTTYSIYALSVDGVFQNQSSLNGFLEAAYSN